MRDALVACSAGEFDTSMPFAFSGRSRQAEVHLKSSYHSGGRYFAPKIASAFSRFPWLSTAMRWCALLLLVEAWLRCEKLDELQPASDQWDVP